MIETVLVSLALALFSYVFYKWASLNNDFFEKRDMKHMKPTFPFGNVLDFIFKKLTAIELAEYFYIAFPNEA